ncbi:anthranilate synthase component II [Acetonema longum]|uniref:Glutamine amidotransferase of anthranilate synthase n=1 Tax=Acetonema longum DSM 6540 TaxID=1009370 RepID=F7NDP5_9FIRM|nr:aminodeoxychorismate/anthranilate synthase component II [Acetonema longum]EGO65814.1 glutamine amidotransferase of anthranilate synthase [Acetonema longum DSM 6540]
MILLIDNYDSFTYNVYQAVANLGCELQVIRNDRLSLPEIEQGNYSAIIISPGPGTPDDAGVSKQAVAVFAGKIPILGICLGHQVIGEVFGGKIIRAPQPVHGKVSRVHHSGTGTYAGVSQPLMAGRYHSLIVDKETLPDCLEATAVSDNGLIMGIRHRQYNIEGVQFHPESILTPEGGRLLSNFLGGIKGNAH